MFGYRDPLRQMRGVGGKAQSFFWKGWKWVGIIVFLLWILSQ